MKQLLHVGCGPLRKKHTTPGFNTPEWHEIRFDIDPDVEPDITGTMTDMHAVRDSTIDAIYSSHNLEHLFPHQVPVALAEFLRVLTEDGFAVITCPDLQSICALVVQDKLTEPAYISPVGPIAPLDMLYGHREPMARGNLFMAHRCGFTRRVLADSLLSAGFKAVAAIARPRSFDLCAVASKSDLSEVQLRVLAGTHFPA